MTKDEIIELLKDNSSDEKHSISISEFVKISLCVKPALEIDRNTLDYYYKINIEDLINSNLPNEEYQSLKEQGWYVDNDSILLYLT